MPLNPQMTWKMKGLQTSQFSSSNEKTYQTTSIAVSWSMKYGVYTTVEIKQKVEQS